MNAAIVPVRVATLTEQIERIVEVTLAAREDEPILANLLELYIHDFSEFHELDIGADGRFGYSSLPLYWSVRGRYPFLVRIDGKLAGLALVKKGGGVSGNAEAWDMAEFFILRGPWEVRVMESNVPALHFWRRAISTFRGEGIQPVDVERDGKSWKVFLFESQ